VFFLVSGLLAARAITRPWARLWRPRILNLLWPFALWSVIFGFVWVYAVFPDDMAPWFSYNLRVIPFGGLAYWYLWTLVVFFVIARVLRRFPIELLLVSVALLALTSSISALVGAGGTHSLTVNVTRLSTFALWFFLGCFGAPVIKRLAPRLGIGAVLASVIGYAALAYAQYYAEPGLDVVFALSITGVAAALSISVVAARFGPVRRAAAYLAKRTLAIYVVHPVMINLLIILVRYADIDLPAGSGAAVAGFLFVPALTVVGTAAAVLAHNAAKRSGASMVFGWPESGLRDRLRRVRRSAGPDTVPAPLSTRH
jgi:uncharacterized membrane protein YcfT